MARKNGRKVKYKFKVTRWFVGLIVVLAVMTGISIWLVIPSKIQKLSDIYSDANILSTTKINVVSNINKLKTAIDSAPDDEYVMVFYGAQSDSQSASNIKTLVTNLSNINSTLSMEGKNEISVYYFSGEDNYNLNTKYTSDLTKYKDKYTEFQKTIESNEALLYGVDLLTTGTFWVYQNKTLLVDTATYTESTSFATTVNNYLALAAKPYLNNN